MTYIRLSLVLESYALSIYERLFEDEALSIVISPVSNEVVIAADLPGENIPIDWREVKLTAYLPLGTDLERLRNDLNRLQSRALKDVDVEIVSSEQTTEVLNNQVVAMQFGKSLRVRPRTNRRVDVADHVPTVYLDAGLAFGSGTHPTTRLCLEWLEANANRAPKSFLDYGCGSGILALAAAAMGNSGCAVDNDNQAIDSAVSNRDFNQIGADRLSILSVSDWQSKKNSLLGSFDFVIANIMMKTLIDLRAELIEALKTDGTLVLSGILVDQVAAVRSCFDEITFEEPVEKDGWIRLVGSLR